jgi:putative ABC transport system permease protein
MFGHYLYSAFVNIKKSAFLSFIKIISLAVGLLCSILVLMHVHFVNSYDKHFSNWQNTYRVVTSYTTDHRINSARTAELVGPQMALDYPQIKHIARMTGGFGELALDRKSIEHNYYWAESDILQIFDLEFISGNSANALDAPNSVIINESVAKQYFDDKPAIGQTLLLDDKVSLKVAGVFKDLPKNTHIDLTIVVSALTGMQRYGKDFMSNPSWFHFDRTVTYLTVENDAAAEEINQDLQSFVARNIPEQQQVRAKKMDLTLMLEPLADIYLSERQVNNEVRNSNRKVVIWGLSLFAMLILVSAAINFINLSISQLPTRMKEIGVRKSLGAKVGQLYVQFLLESYVLTLIALIISIPVIYLVLPAYSNLTNTTLTVENLFQADFVVISALFVVLIGFVSGSIPAAFLSRAETTKVLSGNLLHNGKGHGRTVVTIIQFTFSGTLILLALAIYLQISHLKTMDIGFNRYNLVTLDSKFNRFDPAQFNYQAMVNDFLSDPSVLYVAKSAASPLMTGVYGSWKVEGKGQDDLIQASTIFVDDKYIEAFELKLLAGRGFSQDYPADFIPFMEGEVDKSHIYSVIITKSTVDRFGLSSPEQAIDEIIDQDGYKYRIIGVIDDFRMSGGVENASLSTSILKASNSNLRGLIIRIDANKVALALDHIDAVWAKHRPGVPVDRVFYEQLFNDVINSKTAGISKAAFFAGIITIGMAVLGLYALAFYVTQRRTKEIGVRKVLGATSSSIVALLAWDFIKPIIIACLASCLLGYLAINAFMATFSSRVNFSLLMYASVSISIVIVAFITVALQCYKAANSEPVKSLKYE